MKTKLLIASLMTMILATSCNRNIQVVNASSSKRIPPGQAKKMAGSQSAKPFAPGQQKKTD